MQSYFKHLVKKIQLRIELSYAKSILVYLIRKPPFVVFMCRIYEVAASATCPPSPTNGHSLECNLSPAFILTLFTSTYCSYRSVAKGTGHIHIFEGILLPASSRGGQLKTSFETDPSSPDGKGREGDLVVVDDICEEHRNILPDHRRFIIFKASEGSQTLAV